jgi:hypothetical protein
VNISPGSTAPLEATIENGSSDIVELPNPKSVPDIFGAVFEIESFDRMWR